MEGFVYFIASDRGLIKIGWTSDVQRRLASLQTSSPDLLQLLGYTNGSRVLEASIHERFAAQRIRSEWFADTPELREYISGLLEPGLKTSSPPDADFQDDPIYAENIAVFLRALGRWQEGEAVSVVFRRLSEALLMPEPLIERLWYRKIPSISVGLYRKIEEVTAAQVEDMHVLRRIYRHSFWLSETAANSLKRGHKPVRPGIEPTGLARAEDRAGTQGRGR